jgi:hypothetical protein
VIYSDHFIFCYKFLNIYNNKCYNYCYFYNVKDSLTTAIRKDVQAEPPGTLLFPGDFFHLGKVTAVNMALSRLAREGLVLRVAQGIYYVPKKDPVLGPVRPSLEEIAAALAAKERIRIRPTGVTALNKLGLSTQVPMRVEYLTDGNPRRIKVGRRTLTFQKTTPKRLAVQSPTTFLVIEALALLGKEAADPALLERLEEVLQHEDPVMLREDAQLAPAWIGQFLYKTAGKLGGAL